MTGASSRNGQAKYGVISGGFIGAVAVPGLAIVLCIIQGCLPYGSVLWDIIHYLLFFVSYPILLIVGSLGISGCEGMGYIPHIFAGIFVYLSVVGFVIGMVWAKVAQLLKNRK